MARSRNRGAAGGGRAEREPRATSKKPRVAVPVAEVEVVEEERGLTIDDGIILLTTVLLIVAFFMTDHLLGSDYGKGLFFK